MYIVCAKNGSTCKATWLHICKNGISAAGTVGRVKTVQMCHYINLMY